MYQATLALHNILRWAVLLVGLYAIISALMGMLNKSTWKKTAGLIFTSVFGLQFIIGILLYVVSPLVQGGLKAMSASMKDTNLRLFIVEHPVIMVLAFIIAQAGYMLAKRSKNNNRKHVIELISYALALLLVLSMIPWNRALFPGL